MQRQPIAGSPNSEKQIGLNRGLAVALLNNRHGAVGAQRARNVEALCTRPSRTINHRSSPKHRRRSAGRNASGNLPGRILLELRHPETAPAQTQRKR